jgi:hypothetical protein
MMARSSQTTQPIVKTGLVPVLTAPTSGSGNGDVIDTGRVALMVVAGATAVTVTVETPVTVDGLDVDDLVVDVASGATALIGPFASSTFGQTTSTADVTTDVGRAYVTYDNATTVTRAVVSL